MPRGFLVKRNSRQKEPFSYRVRQHSVEDRSDSGSDYENNVNANQTYSDDVVIKVEHGVVTSESSIVYKTFGLRDDNDKDENGFHEAPSIYRGASPSTSLNVIKPIAFVCHTSCTKRPTPRGPPSSTEPPSFPALIKTHVPSLTSSPFYFSTFDRLSVSSPREGGPTISYAHQKHQPSNTVTSIYDCPQDLSLRKEQVTGATKAFVIPSSPKKRNVATERNRTSKRPKAARKLTFDEDMSSPVSGTIIRELTEREREDGMVMKSGDIDPSLNIVDVTPEAQAELSLIENKIGDYVCRLCSINHSDAFQLAQHRCSRIVHIEYRCPECDKVFNCPANLASHRRWHKPRQVNKVQHPAHILPATSTNLNLATTQNDAKLKIKNNTVLENQREGLFICDSCGKKFRRQAYLRKHVSANHMENPMENQPITSSPTMLTYVGNASDVNGNWDYRNKDRELLSTSNQLLAF